MRNKDLQSIYRLMVLSAIVLFIGCQAPLENNDNVIKPPDWIYQKEFKEFPEDEYFVEVGVSNRSFDDAQARALYEFKRQILPKLEFLYVGSSYQNQVIKELASLVQNKIDDFKEIYNGKENGFRASLILDYAGIFNSVFLENTLSQAQHNEYRSWAETFAVSRKKYTDGFTHYMLLTFYRKWMLENQTAYLIDVTNDDKSLDIMRANHSEMNFDKFVKTLYRMIDLYQYLTFQVNSDERLKEEVGAIQTELKGLIDKNVLTLYRDFDVQFSENNIIAWLGKYTDKIEIKIFWKRKLVKLPLWYENSTDAMIELIESTKDDVSYELRIMPKSKSNQENKSGQHFIEFDLKPEGLRFSKLINFALKKKLYYTLPTKENSSFKLDVFSENLKLSSKIQQGFADNISKSLKSNLELWCENNGYTLNTSVPFLQTQENQHIYGFRILVGFENLSIIESKKKKFLKVDVLLHLYFWDESLQVPKWVRLKQDRFVYSNEIPSAGITEESNIFDLYCAGMVVNVDFQKSLSELVEKAFK